MMFIFSLLFAFYVWGVTVEVPDLTSGRRALTSTYSTAEICGRKNTICIGDCVSCNSTRIGNVIPHFPNITLYGGVKIYLVGSSSESTEHSEELKIELSAPDHENPNYIEPFPGHTIVWKDESFDQLLSVTGSYWRIHSGEGTLVLENLDRSVTKDFISVSNVKGFHLGPLSMNLRHKSISMKNLIGVDVGTEQNQRIFIDSIRFSYFDSSYVDHAISFTSNDKFHQSSAIDGKLFWVKKCYFSAFSKLSTVKISGSPKYVRVEGSYFPHDRSDFSPSSFIEISTDNQDWYPPVEVTIQNSVFEVGSGTGVKLTDSDISFVYKNTSISTDFNFYNNLLLNPNKKLVGVDVSGPSTIEERLVMRVVNNIMTHPFNSCEPLLKTAIEVNGTFGNNFRSWACPKWVDMDSPSLVVGGLAEFDDSSGSIFYKSGEKPYPYYTLNTKTFKYMVNGSKASPAPTYDYFFRNRSSTIPTPGPFENLCEGTPFCGYSVTHPESSRGLCNSGPPSDWEAHKCECMNGYSGPLCTCLPNIQYYSSASGRCECVNTDGTHYVIEGTTCVCESGYGGDRCTYPKCYGYYANDHDHDVCGGDDRGECDRPDKCVCEADYFGDECERVWGVSQKIGLGFVCFFVFLSLFVCLCVMCIDSVLFVVVRNVEGRKVIDFSGLQHKLDEKLEQRKKLDKQKKEEKDDDDDEEEESGCLKFLKKNIKFGKTTTSEENEDEDEDDGEDKKKKKKEEEDEHDDDAPKESVIPSKRPSKKKKKKKEKQKKEEEEEEEVMKDENDDDEEEDEKKEEKSEEELDEDDDDIEIIVEDKKDEDEDAEGDTDEEDDVKDDDDDDDDAFDSDDDDDN